MDFKTLLKAIEKDPEFEHGKPPTKEGIQSMEKELNVQFTPEYRFLLEEYGFISWSGGDLFGYSVDAYFDTVARTMQKKNAKQKANYKPFPNNGNVISYYPGGGFYFLFGSNSEKPGVVVQYLDETWWTPEREWISLQAFIEDRNQSK